MNKPFDPRPIIDRHLHTLVDQVDSALGAIAVTTDGHFLCGAQRKEIPGKRLAAMGSTLMSLGNTITKELEMGACRNVISENERGVVVFMQITSRIVLVAAAGDRSALGMLLSASRNCLDKIKTELNIDNKEQQNGKSQ